MTASPAAGQLPDNDRHERDPADKQADEVAAQGNRCDAEVHRFWCLVLIVFVAAAVGAHINISGVWPVLKAPLITFGSLVVVISVVVSVLALMKCRDVGFKASFMRIQSLAFIVLLGGILLSALDYFAADAAQWSLTSSEWIHVASAELLGSSLATFLRYAVVAVVVIFVAQMFSVFRATQEQQSQLNQDLREAQQNQSDETIALSRTLRQLGEATDVVERATGAAISSIQLVAAQLKFGLNLEKGVSFFAAAQQAGHAKPAEMMAAFQDQLRGMYDRVINEVCAGIPEEELDGHDEYWNTDEGVAAYVRTAILLACFGEYAAAEIGGIFDGRFYQFRTSFVHYAAAVQAMVEALKHYKDRFHYYTLMSKSPMQFLNYIDADETPETHIGWLPFLRFNREVLRTDVNYHRYFLSCEERILQDDFAKRCGGAHIVATTEALHALDNRDVVVKTVSDGEAPWPVLACDSCPDSWDGLPRVDEVTARAVLPGVQLPCFIMSSEAHEIENIPTNCTKVKLREALAAFHGEDKCAIRRVNRAEFDALFSSPDMPVDAFAVLDRGDTGEDRRWVCCLGVVYASEARDDAALMRFYRPPLPNEDGNPEWTHISDYLDTIFIDSSERVDTIS